MPFFDNTGDPAVPLSNAQHLIGIFLEEFDRRGGEALPVSGGYYEAVKLAYLAATAPLHGVL
ncbi:MAG: hypothetical protein AVDCRST_MAG28-3275 [uncultured Rubrobacteraceae bacterium]|uniref:Uncharacterized protein n=1 Tax=uncultured Rubrobacteraceae bacterium TaxID=349277 RepID=A0A6J4R4A0_9ACTN|nr:MAG: hypothetical protein AVDCRST_MAG28-3275 [uncultured Rubrobacteraceae bacterium]